jgi:hypothetical protein
MAIAVLDILWRQRPRPRMMKTVYGEVAEKYDISDSVVKKAYLALVKELKKTDL